MELMKVRNLVIPALNYLFKNKTVNNKLTYMK